MAACLQLNLVKTESVIVIKSSTNQLLSLEINLLFEESESSMKSIIKGDVKQLGSRFGLIGTGRALWWGRRGGGVPGAEEML